MNGLRGSTALVTGAGRGIGQAIALRLAAEGVRVAVNDIDARSAAALVAEIDASGGHGLAVVGDVANEQDAKRMIRDAVDVLGGLDGLVNNAGVDAEMPLQDVDRVSWSRLHDVDVWAPLLMVREAERALADARGCVVNISSTHAIATVPHRTAYAAAKAGIVGLTRALAVELGPVGIRVNAVLPGYIRTPIWDLWLDRVDDPEALLTKIARRHPLKRLGTPADVAGLVAFLMSSDAAFISGATLVADGGYTALLEAGAE